MRTALANAEYYLANKERLKENARLYYYHNAPECQMRNRRYYAQNKDTIRTQRGRTKREPPAPTIPLPIPLPKEKTVLKSVYQTPKSRAMVFSDASFTVDFS
jgi:hypothetical protein